MAIGSIIFPLCAFSAAGLFVVAGTGGFFLLSCRGCGFRGFLLLMAAANDRYMPALTGVRALAAYLVFLHHYIVPGGVLQGIMREGHVGVTMFFVLSGFLICHRYYDTFSLSREFIRPYVVNRIARIYPLYFILTTLTFLHLHFYLHDGSAKHNLVVYLLNISFLRGFFEHLKFSGIAQGWSLTVEECFYFSALFIFPFIKQKRALVALLLIFSITFSYILFRHVDVYGFMNRFDFTVLYTFFGRCFEFFVGIFLALYLRRKGVAQLNRRVPVATIGGSISIVLAMWYMSTVKGQFPFGMFDIRGIITNNWILPFGIAAFYYGLIKERSWLSQLLGSKLFDVLGKSSYAFYLVHIGIFATFITGYVTANVWFAFILLNLLSILLYYLVEHPLNIALRRWLLPKTAKAVAVTQNM